MDVWPVIGDVLRHPKTPMRILERYFDATDPQIEWGLALNPQLPLKVMQRLSRSPDRYTRFNLTYNPATPVAILETLARDPDPTLATHAAQALARRAKGNAGVAPGREDGEPAAAP